MLSDWTHRLRSLFKRRAVEQELDEELLFHVEQHVASQMGKGVAREEAVRLARLEFGGIEQIKEEHRDARGIAFVDDVARDVGYAIRQLGRSPGFTVLAVLCLGLGIGVNTSIFGVLNSVLLRPMPVADPDRLIRVGRGPSAAFSYPAYRDLQPLQVGIRPADLSTHVTIGLIWIAVALVACYVPAARAARVDPLVALRCE